MAVNGYHDYGEEWAQKFAWRQDLLGTRDTTVEYLLYLDSTDYDNDGTVEGDNLSDSSDVGAITTEPSDGNYARVPLDLDSTDVTVDVDSNNNVRVTAQPSFDVSSTTGYVDACAAVISFQSDVVNSETGQNPHIIASSKLEGGALNLEQSTTVNVNMALSQN